MLQKTKRMLELLDKQVLECKECSLYHNGRLKPYWTEESEILMVGESPNKKEVQKNEPFIDEVGDYLWDAMKQYGFKKEQFLIINSINCMSIVGNRKGKPTKEQMKKCKPFIRKYMRVLKPYTAIYLGKYASETMGDLQDSIITRNANIFKNDDLQLKEGVFSIHPSMIIYKGEEGKQMLLDSVCTLKGINDIPF